MPGQDQKRKHEYVISLNKAIEKGLMHITIPQTIFFLIVHFAGLYLMIIKAPDRIVIIVTILGFVFAWMYWSYMITKWRLWAFEVVRNVHTLQHEGERHKLIWPRHHFFEKTEFRNSRQRKKWKSLEKKFTIKDTHVDDIIIPEETIITFSTYKNALELMIAIFIQVFGIFFALVADTYILSAILILIGIILCIKEIIELHKSSPQIIINNRGIQTVNTSFLEWKEVYDEKSSRVESGKLVRNYLKYKHPGGTENICIDKLDINQVELSKLLNTYRKRYEQNTKNTSPDKR